MNPLLKFKRKAKFLSQPYWVIICNNQEDILSRQIFFPLDRLFPVLQCRLCSCIAMDQACKTLIIDDEKRQNRWPCTSKVFCFATVSSNHIYLGLIDRHVYFGNFELSGVSYSSIIRSIHIIPYLCFVIKNSAILSPRPHVACKKNVNPFLASAFTLDLLT